MAEIDSSLLILRIVSASISDKVNCLTLLNFRMQDDNGILSVTIISSIIDSSKFCAALPEKTAWVAYA